MSLKKPSPSSSSSLHDDNDNRIGEKIQLLLDIETADPDDILMLLLACSHPKFNLLAVTITPGTPHQVFVVRSMLTSVLGDNHGVDVGAYNLQHAAGTNKTCVSPFHQYALNLPLEQSNDAEPGHIVLRRHWKRGTTLVTGAPLNNVGKLLYTIEDEIEDNNDINNENDEKYLLGKWIAQGGFAGE
jgi:inosine-uridine nucleoside N-ribohydrolase